jgi:hypothetical protein
MVTEGELLVLLSESLHDVLKAIIAKHKCKVAEDLLEAHDLITGYNFIRRNMFSVTFDQSVFDKDLSYTKKCLLDRINELLTDEARMLSVRFNEFEISYLPKGKQPVYSSPGTWGRENRQTAKPARIVQKVLAQKYSCKEFEDFSNWLKAELVNSGDFHLVTGPDITRYYNADTYLKEEGTLGNSCMRYDTCSSYFTVYEDHAKMLVCLRQGKLIGRAIVWTVGDKTLMDRVYTCFDYLENQFIDYARANKWYHRVSNELLENRETQEWLGPDSDYKTPVRLDLSISLGKSYDYMPYVDSFRYYDPDALTINTIWKRGMYFLDCTDGEYYDGCDDDYDEDDEDCEEYTCEACGYVERAPDYSELEEIVWSDIDSAYYCRHCAVYCDGVEEYVGPNHPTVNVWISEDETERYPIEAVSDDSDFIKIDDEWYYFENPLLEFDENTNKYFLKDQTKDE